MNIRNALRAAVLILILTTGLGLYVDVRDHELHARNMQIRSGLEESLRAKGELSSMLLIAVLEQNMLRSKSYEKVSGDLDRAVKSVAELNRDLKFSREITALLARHHQLQATEVGILELMRSGQWPQARAALLDADYVRSASMHEIDIKTTVGAMTNELAEQTELFDMLRVLGVTLRIASLVLLLWVGFAYSRQLVAEVARHKRIHDELGASQRALRDLAAHQEAEINAERKRMAQEIHDELGQRLTVLRMDIALLPRAVASDPTVLLPQRVRALKIDIDAIMTIVREVASRLRPEALEVGLSAAAESLLDEFQQSMGIPCELDNQLPANLQLDEARLTTVFRILQESLTNVARHAQASHILVILTLEHHQLRLQIRDDGQGMSTAPVRTFGITGMRERTTALGGTLRIFGGAIGGTTVEMLLPL